MSDTLQRKLKDLEEENLSLRSEVICTHRDTHAQFKVTTTAGNTALITSVFMQANHLKSETETYEEKEQQLVNDCVKELSRFLHFRSCPK